MIYAVLLFVLSGLLLLGLVGGLMMYYLSKCELKCTVKKHLARGVIFGRLGPIYFYSPAAAEGHIFIGGGSGTGKTSALLIPTLLAWDGTSFVIDISGDISSNVPCRLKLVYEPGNPLSVAYNIFWPIDEATDEDDRLEALEQLAWLIMPELKNSSANADYFQNGGRAILTAALIWGYRAGMDFCDICAEIMGSSYISLFARIDRSQDDQAIRYINQFEGNSEQNTAGCKQNADRAIALFATNEKVKATIHRPAPGEISFSCGSVEGNNVFVLVPDARLELFAPLLHIITAQVLNHLAARAPAHKAPILLALDEFASLGKMEITPALRKLRKRHVRIMLLTQSMADIDELYTREARMSMMNNFAFKVILSAGDTDSQKYYADLIGMKDKPKSSVTRGSIFSQATETKSTERAYIIEPADLANMGKSLVLLTPGGYIRLHKNFYFK